VAAVWHLADASWIVVRPFDEEEQQSYVVQGSQWQLAFDPKADRKSFDSFIRAINDQLDDKLPLLRLSKSSKTRGSKTQFADVLPWLCRDTQIGFHKPDLWRDRDVNQTKQNSRTTNRLLMKWLMGLVSPLEANSRNLKLQSNEEAKTASHSFEQKQLRLETLYESIKRAANFEEPQPGDSQIPIPQVDLAAKLAEFIRDQYRSATNRKDNLESMQDELDKAENLVFTLQKQVISALLKEEQAHSKALELEIHLRAEKKQTKAPTDCPGKQDCLWHQEIERNRLASSSPDELNLIQRLNEQQSEAKTWIETATKELAELEEKLKSAQEHAEKLRADFDRDSLAREADFVRWEQLDSMAGPLRTAVGELERAEHTRVMTEDDVVFHKTVISNANDNPATKQNLVQIERCYAHTLARIYDDFSTGALDLSNGLIPNVDNDRSRHGTALSTLQNILAYDLACVLASASGVGSHPGLLIHDGAREGEAESELYLNLLQTAEWMQSLFPSEELPFQYIVTTADAPESYEADHPAVVATLDGRTDDGLLLRRRF
jgi:hypothetical protein